MEQGDDPAWANCLLGFCLDRDAQSENEPISGPVHSTPARAREKIPTRAVAAASWTSVQTAE